MNLTCIIVDDEELTIQHLLKYISKISYLSVKKYFTEPEQAIEYLKNNKVDVVFLDVEMPNSNIDGIDLISIVETEQNYILTTSHPEYALKGFDYSVIDFLHKPYSFDRFLAAIKKLQIKSQCEPINEDIFIKTEGKLHKILLKDICYIKSEKNNISIFTDSDRINAIYTLSDIEDKLPKNMFVRVHKSFIISLEKIEAIDGEELILKKGKNSEKQIPIGEFYKRNLMSIIDNKILKK